MNYIKKYAAVGIITAIIIAAILIIGIPKSQVAKSGDKNIGISIGKTAPDFELQSLEGESVKLSDFSGKNVVLNFWASWCPPCREEMPEFQVIYAENQEKLVFIGVNLQESRENAESFVEKLGITFPILLDPDAQVKEMYNVFTQPVTYFIDSNGKIVDKKFGPLTSEEINEKIAKMGVKGDAQANAKSFENDDEIKTLKDGTKYTIHPDKFLSGGPGKDGIPSIDDPKFNSVKDADWLSDEELGLGIVHKNEARFYPFRILVYHEIVNDFIQDDPILVTYCPLCFTGIGFISKIEGEAVEFGVSGKLYNSELVMYDRKTDSYWPQTLGKSVLGPSTGKTIKKIPTDTVKWKDWKKVHPDTKVLSRNTGFIRSYDGSNPYGKKGDFTDINLQFPLENKDSRLDGYEIVYGIEINGKFKAYKKSDVEKELRIEDNLGGEKIIIEFGKGLQSAKAYKESGGQIVVETLFWFAWAAFHPDTELYKF
jgi:peroxiredoxin